MTSTSRTGGGVVGRVIVLIARLIRLVVAIAVVVIVVAIVLRVLKANPSNQIVIDFHKWGHDLVGPAHNLFSIHNPKVAIAVNWGIAAIVISVVGGLIARIIARIGIAAGA
jgi:hypothetical protein